MATAVFQFVAAAALIIVAGAALTRCADAIADLTGMGRLLVGSILLAGATSLPELTVDINAVRLGMPDLAVGDLLGSTLFNLLILALLDLSHRSHGQMLSRMSAAHALSGTASIALVALAAVCILGGHHWPAAAVGGVGLGSFAILLAYTLAVRMVFYDQRLSAQLAATQPVAPAAGEHTFTPTKAAIGFCLAAVAIVCAGPYMAEAAGKIAELSGLGGTFVGSTLVAFSTSLPELVATFTALRIGAFDLAIGNIYGSNAFNILLLVPLDFTSTEPLYSVVSSTHAVTCLCAVLITSVAVMGQLYQVERRVRFMEPDAMLVITLVIASLGLIYLLR